MPREHADREILSRAKSGALKVRVPATGSSLSGGSVAHRSGRKRLNRALHAGKAILVRVSDGVCLRAATWEDCAEWFRMPSREFFVPTVLAEDGVSYGTLCTVKRWAPELDTKPAFDAKPRLVKHK
jgi:hypothetical protein